jgi:hypothetical protein
MKKLQTLAVLALLMLIFWGCSQPPNPSVSSTATAPSTSESNGFEWHDCTWYGPLGEAAFLTEDLFFFLSGDQSILTCSDVNTGTTIALCNKIPCQHDDQFCEASIFGDKYTPIFFWNDGIYYTETDGYGTHLYRRNADGTGLSEVATLCEAEMEKGDVDIFINYSILADGKYYFGADIYTVEILEGGVLQDKRLKSQICCLDLRTGKQTVLVDSPGDDAVIVLMAAGGNKVVYSCSDNLSVSNTDPDYANALRSSAISLICVDENTKQQKTILEKTRAEFNAPKFYDGCIVYSRYNAETTEHRTAFDLNTLEESESMLMGVSIINRQYGLKAYWDSGSRTNHVVELETDARLPLELPGNFRLLAVSDRGLVVRMTEFNKHKEEPTDETTLYYIPVSALPDGIQAEDATVLYHYRHN